MARMLIAIYESFYTANQAIRELRNSGFPNEMIIVKSRRRWETTLETSSEGETKQNKKREKSEIYVNGPSAGTQVGLMIGAAIGAASALLSILGTIHLPGMLPDTTALTMAASSLVTGAVFGRLLGGSIDLGIPEQEIREYAKNVRDGSIEVSILADWDSIDPVKEILGRHAPLELREKAVAPNASGSIVAASQVLYFDHRRRERR